MKVPDNTDIASWTHPAFEHTVIYDRLTEGERAKLLAEGVPQGDQLLFQFFVMDLFTILLGWICFRHARKYFGFWMASCFLIGSFVFTGLEESMWILLGRFIPQTTSSPLGEPVYGTYWFTKGALWFLETPITACIGWFFLAYSCVLVAGKVFPKMGLLGTGDRGRPDCHGDRPVDGPDRHLGSTDELGLGERGCSPCPGDSPHELHRLVPA